MSTGNAWTIEQGAYEVIRKTQPSLIMTITGLLLRGQTPAQIINFINARDVFLAGIVECAIPVIQEKISNSTKGLPFGGEEQVKP